MADNWVSAYASYYHCIFVCVSVCACVCVWVSVCVLFSFRLFCVFVSALRRIFNKNQCYVAVCCLLVHMATAADTVKMCIVNVYTSTGIGMGRQQKQQQRPATSADVHHFRSGSSQNICSVVRAFTTILRKPLKVFFIYFISR